jgi:hypothetical protein
VVKNVGQTRFDSKVEPRPDLAGVGLPKPTKHEFPNVKHICEIFLQICLKFGIGKFDPKVEPRPDLAGVDENVGADGSVVERLHRPRVAPQGGPRIGRVTLHQPPQQLKLERR